nr:hypothetical protein [Tanacetum cinerariifolium]
MCDICKIFGHVHDHCPNKVVSPPIVTTSNVVAPIVVRTNDGFQTVGTKKKKKKKGKSKASNGGQFAGDAQKKGATVGPSSKNDNKFTSNSYSALNVVEEDDDEVVENVYGESANIFTNSQSGGSSSFTVDVG